MNTSPDLHTDVVFVAGASKSETTAIAALFALFDNVATHGKLRFLRAHGCVHRRHVDIEARCPNVSCHAELVMVAA